jgi:succinate dehydrogenase / fumarate reductase membrane anchor subunit
MHPSTKKWLFTKISSLFLIPFMIWFLISFVSIYDKGYEQILAFFLQQSSKILFSIFIVLAFFFSALTISEIFEDYLHNNKIKNVANKALYLFAILIPFITILNIYNLNL